jgi:hypothetical protein
MNNRCISTLIVFLTLVLVPVTHATAQAVTLAQAVVCQEVVDRTPVGSGDVFPAGVERLFCFTRIEGAQGETEITHNWYYQGVLKASVVLPVRASSWRTWSTKALLPEWTGEWMVEVLAKDGTPLESISFSVQ